VWREKGGDDVRFPDSFIVFTTQTGGSYWVRRATEAQYHKAAKDGYWEDQIDEVNSKRRQTLTTYSGTQGWRGFDIAR
jgi:hypothetical protein